MSGVIHFCDNKPREITERAADCGLNHGKIGLNNFKKSYELVKNSPAELAGEGILPEHTNLRGKGYYR